MRKIQKRKVGFTLVEMVLVIAIIAILASVLFISVNKYLDTARSAENKVNSDNSSFSSANSQINQDFISLGY